MTRRRTACSPGSNAPLCRQGGARCRGATPAPPAPCANAVARGLPPTDIAARERTATVFRARPGRRRWGPRSNGAGIYRRRLDESHGLGAFVNAGASARPNVSGRRVHRCAARWRERGRSSWAYKHLASQSGAALEDLCLHAQVSRAPRSRTICLHAQLQGDVRALSRLDRRKIRSHGGYATSAGDVDRGTRSR
jgi:hypothetical protein